MWGKIAALVSDFFRLVFDLTAFAGFLGGLGVLATDALAFLDVFVELAVLLVEETAGFNKLVAGSSLG